MKEDITREVEVPAGVSATIVETTLLVKGKAGEVKREIGFPSVKVAVDGQKIVIQALKATKREKRMIGTFEAHIKNMIQGAQEKFVYGLKICSGHFPMNVSLSGNTIIVKNFLGEKHPRKVNFSSEVAVKINGFEIEVSGSSKELAGQTAGKIEKLCNITNRDRRIFQDGIYITKKA
jgi:large subunit ribosomal protein L6